MKHMDTSWTYKWRNGLAVVHARQIPSRLASVFWLNVGTKGTVFLLSIWSAHSSKGICHFSSRYESCMITRLFFQYCSLQQLDRGVRTDNTGTYSTHAGTDRSLCVHTHTRLHIRYFKAMSLILKVNMYKLAKLPGDLESEQHLQLIQMFVHSPCIQMSNTALL